MFCKKMFVYFLMCCFTDSCDDFFLSELPEWLFLFVVCAAKLLLFFELCNTQNAVSDRLEANGSLRTRDSLSIPVNQNVNQLSDPTSSHALTDDDDVTSSWAFYSFSFCFFFFSFFFPSSLNSRFLSIQFSSSKTFFLTHFSWQ